MDFDFYANNTSCAFQFVVNACTKDFKQKLTRNS